MNIPTQVLDQHIAVVGKTGSGKTNTAKLMIEQVVKAGHRVCILDPIKSDYWGLTLNADGKRAGLPFSILGGPKQHVPLHSGAGAAIAELVARGSLGHSILDMAEFEPGGHFRFLIDFAPVVMKRMRGVVYLVMEEAHLFAPKERSGVGPETMAIHWAKALATAGRSKGIRLVVITQRTQALHNAMLGACDSIFAHRLTSPADQKPVLEWFKSNASKEIADGVAASIAKLKTGEAWIFSGESGLLERGSIDRAWTFDNTATPTGNEGLADVQVPPVDEAALRSIIGEAVAEAEANDPKKLRARIAELEEELENAENAAARAVGVDPIEAERVQRERDDAIDALAEANRRGEELDREISDWFDHVTAAREALNRITHDPAKVPGYQPVSVTEIPHQEGQGTSVAPSRAYATPTQPSANGVYDRPRTVSVRDGTARPPHHNARGTGNRAGSPAASEISGPERKGLEAFLWYELLDIAEPTDEQLCYRLGYSPTSSTISVLLSKLRRNGYVEGHRITVAGRELVDPPDIGTLREFHDQIRQFLAGSAAKVFDLCLRAHPKELSAAAICREFGWSEASSTLSVALSAIRRAGLMEKRSHRLTATVFPEALT